jgi:hypothetical protein
VISRLVLQPIISAWMRIIGVLVMVVVGDAVPVGAMVSGVVLGLCSEVGV